MEDTSAFVEQQHFQKESDQIHRTHKQNDPNSGWQTVSYTKRNRKVDPLGTRAAKHTSDPLPNGGADVFRSIEAHAEERRRKLLEARLAATAAGTPVVTRRGEDDGEDSDAEVSGDGAGGAGGEVKKVKQKKLKKPKVTVAEAAARMDIGDLGAFLDDITVRLCVIFVMT